MTEDWRIVAFTGVLMVVAICQLLAQLRQSRYMRQGLDETQRSSEAAKASADAALAAMYLGRLQLRPYLVSGGCSYVVVDPNVPFGDHCVDIHFVNKGATPTGITEIDARYSFALVTPERSSTIVCDAGHTWREVFPQETFTYRVESRPEDLQLGPFHLQVYGHFKYLNRPEAKSESVNFGFVVRRSESGVLTTEEAPGMRDSLASAERRRKAEQSA